jgi:hypothetical protein
MLPALGLRKQEKEREEKDGIKVTCCTMAQEWEKSRKLKLEVIWGLAQWEGRGYKERM